MKRNTFTVQISVLLLSIMLFVMPVMRQSEVMVYAATEQETDSKETEKTKKEKPKLSESKLKLKVGETQQLTCVGASGNLKWKSEDKSIASVDKNGLIKAKNPGKTVVTVTGKEIGTLKCVVRVKITQKQALARIQNLEKTYPEGMLWTNENNMYYWEVSSMYCFGCIAFAAEVSDKVFGKNASFTTHEDFDKIKVGDHIRIGNYHSVIVLKKSGDVLTLVEGNYNASVHWRRVISRQSLERTGFYVDTRY